MSGHHVVFASCPPPPPALPSTLPPSPCGPRAIPAPPPLHPPVGTRDSRAVMLLGSQGWVQHKEDGVLFGLDVTRCMFSSGEAGQGHACLPPPPSDAPLSPLCWPLPWSLPPQ